MSEIPKHTVFSLAFNDTLKRYTDLTVAKITEIAREQGAGLTKSRIGLFKNGHTSFGVKNLESVLLAIKSIDMEIFNFYINRLTQRVQSLEIAQPAIENKEIDFIYHLADLLENYTIEEIGLAINVDTERLDKLLDGENPSSEEIAKIDTLIQKHLKVTKSLLL